MPDNNKNNNNSIDLLSIVQRDDVWSECLGFLSPPEMEGLPAVIRAGGSPEQPERASWLALESAVRSAERMAPAAAATPRPVRLYPGETWLGLYSLFWSLVRSAEDSEGRNPPSDGGEGSMDEDVLAILAAVDTAEAIPRNEDESHPTTNDDDEEEEETPSNDEEGQTETANERRKKIWLTACWLLLDWSEGGRVPLSSLSSCKTLGHRNFLDLLGVLLSEKASEEIARRRRRRGKRERSTGSGAERWKYGTRMLQSALRLSDAGAWAAASGLLAPLVADVPGGSGSSPTCDAEIRICICTFLIDRMYSNTYVRRDDNDSADLSRAVSLGREAIRMALAQQHSDSGSTEPYRGASGDDDDNHQHNHEGGSKRKPPLPVSLFPSPSLRLAHACLATGKALALLAQHIGLSATSVEEIDVSPRSHGATDASPDELFFAEGESILRASIARLEEEIRGIPGRIDDSSSTKATLFEVQAASCAALGELYYCFASATAFFDVDLMVQRTNKSIEHLHESLHMVQQRLVAMMEERVSRSRRALPHDPTTIELLCSSAPRSLLLLQARTAKDLGKVYGFAQRFGENRVFARKEKNVLSFALAICSRLHFDDHPSISNIRRLGRNYNELSSEQDVNLWLTQDPLLVDL